MVTHKNTYMYVCKWQLPWPAFVKVHTRTFWARPVFDRAFRLGLRQLRCGSSWNSMFQNITGWAKDRVLCDKYHTYLPDEPRTQKSTQGAAPQAGLSELILWTEQSVEWGEWRSHLGQQWRFLEEWKWCDLLTCDWSAACMTCEKNVVLGSICSPTASLPLCVPKKVASNLFLHDLSCMLFFQILVTSDDLGSSQRGKIAPFQHELYPGK